MPRSTPETPARIVLAGIHGFGATYLGRFAHLEAAGLGRVTGLCDPRPPLDDEPAGHLGVPWSDSLPDLLARVPADVVVVAAPIDAHAELTRAAFRAGADVLLEKPPTPTLADFDTLVAEAAQLGRRCQVGFQSFGCDAIESIREAVQRGELGTVRGIGVAGAWVRRRTYWVRSRWAGHRELEGRAISDGVVANPLAHAVATALRLDGSDLRGDVDAVDAEVFHANDIETDDTSSVRLRTRRGTTITAALTLCARRDHEPSVTVYGSRGRSTLWYKTGRVETTTPPGTQRRSFGFTDLLTDLIEHRHDPATPLLSELPRSGAFTEVLEAVRTTPPARIGAEHVDVVGAGTGEHVVVQGVDELVARSARTLRTYSELGAAWAVPGTLAARPEEGS